MSNFTYMLLNIYYVKYNNVLLRCMMLFDHSMRQRKRGSGGIRKS
jgi:hypothetical protein